MRFLVDLNHPAHVHLFRHAVQAWLDRGDEVTVTARAKDVTVQLLTAMGVPHRELAPVGRGFTGRVRELFEREAKLLALAREWRPDLILGTSVHAGRVAKLVGARSAVLNEDDAAAVPLFRWLAYPFADAIVTPECLAGESYGSRHWTYPAYHELFYLHPARFRPRPEVLAELGVEPSQPFGLVRLSALDAHHDSGVRGLREELLHEVVRRLPPGFRLFISGEKPVPKAFESLRVALPAEKMHDALAYASFFLGDSQTMTAEAAVLGVPALRLNDFVGRLSYLEELESYGLAFGFRPGEESRLLERLDDILTGRDSPAEFASRRERMLKDKIDPLPWFLAAMDAVAQGRPAPGPRQASK